VQTETIFFPDRDRVLRGTSILSERRIHMKKYFLLILGYVYFFKFTFRETTFQTFLCLFAIKKVDQRKTLSSQRKIWLDFQKSVFPGKFRRKIFPDVVKNLEMSYYLLIISNLVLKLLIALYILF